MCWLGSRSNKKGAARELIAESETGPAHSGRWGKYAPPGALTQIEMRAGVATVMENESRGGVCLTGVDPSLN